MLTPFFGVGIPSLILGLMTIFFAENVDYSLTMILGVAGMMAFFSAMFSVPAMIVFGIPVIIVVEILRPAKGIAAFLYIVVGFASGSLSFWGLGNELAGNLIAGGMGLGCGLVTALIMLFQREDW